MRYVAVMPWIVEHYKDACLAGCAFDPLLVIDNTGTNLGVMRSHNLGVDVMREHDADWLVVLSAAVRFGAAGGLDFVSALERSPEHAVVSANEVFGWHLIAFSRQTVELAGRWDENFTPYGFDDNDYAIRIHKSQPHAVWSRVDCALSDTTMAHSLKLGGVYVNATPQLDYFAEKWGDRPGPPFEAYHDTPWNDPTKPLGWWPPPAGLGPVDGARWDEAAPFPAQAALR